jgi:acetyl-CoA acetyltransferase
VEFVTGAASVVGIGLSELAPFPNSTASRLAVQALGAALADAGLRANELDGLLVNGRSEAPGKASPVGLLLQRSLQLRDLAFLSEVQLADVSALAMVQYAALAVRAGLATTIACVFADARTRQWTEGDPGSPTATPQARYYADLAAGYAAGRDGPDADLYAVLSSAQEWARLAPGTAVHERIGATDYRHTARLVGPLGQHDFCPPTSGAAVVIVAGDDRSKDLRQQPVRIAGFAQRHWMSGPPSAPSAVAGANAAALAMAGAKLVDVDVLQFSDPSTISVVTTLEEYGLCEPGAGLEFVAAGSISPGGAVPVNTSGGQLAGFDLRDMTPLVEAVTQLRGGAGERQVARHSLGLVGSAADRNQYHCSVVLTV